MHGLLKVAVATTLALNPRPFVQASIVDEGSFSITVNGEPAGREDFRIRKTPGARGFTYIASATVVIRGQRIEPKLETDSSYIPFGYDVTSRHDGESESLHGRIGGGRTSVQIQTARGPQAKEFLVAERPLVLEDDVFHQYYFLAKRKAAGAVPVITPRKNAQVTMRVTSGGPDRVTIGNQTIVAERLIVSDQGGGDREVWVDASGRVLKVAIPSRGIVATRDDPPR
jgi:hypothetical protein